MVEIFYKSLYETPQALDLMIYMTFKVQINVIDLSIS